MNAETSGLLYSIDVGAEEKEFPVVFFLLASDHAAHLFQAVGTAGIFHAVGRDDEDGLFGHVFLSGVFMHVADVVDRMSECIQKRRAAPYIVLTSGHGLNLADIHAVVENFLHIVEENCGHISFPVLFFLLIDHAVETADRIGFQPVHGSASVQYKNKFCQSFSHPVTSL